MGAGHRLHMEGSGVLPEALVLREHRNGNGSIDARYNP
jgi:hypothetical protein